MKKVQLITLSLLCSFAYGQDTAFLEVNYIKLNSKELATNNKTTYYNAKEGKNSSQKTFYLSGKTESETNFLNNIEDIRNGSSIKWYENGQIKSLINYTNDTIDGTLVTFWENGNPKRQDVYKMGKLMEGNCYDKDGNEVKYYNYEIMPEFIGGTKAMFSYLKKEIHYPVEAIENNYTGKVIVSFTVSEKGKISDEKIMKGNADCLNNEALRLVKQMPEWNPGQLDGEFVKMQVGVPILFLIAD